MHDAVCGSSHFHRSCWNEIKVSGTFFGPSSGPQCGLELETRGGRRLPTGITKRNSAPDTVCYVAHFRRPQSRMDQSGPVRRQLHRPITEHNGGFSPLTHSEARPSPQAGILDQPGSHRVSLNVPQHAQIVQITLHRKTLVSPLIQVPDSDGTMRAVVSLRLRESHPTHETRQVTILPRPYKQMPVVAHDAVAA